MSDTGEEIEVYVTEKALTRGVYMLKGRVYRGSDIDHPAFDPSGRHGRVYHPHWHVTKASAEQQIKTLIGRRWKSISKEKEKLDRISTNLKLGSLPMAQEKPRQ